MTYNPEFNVWADQQIESLKEDTSKIKNLVGDSPLTELIAGIDNLLEVAVELKKDYDVCFNDQEREPIKKDIQEILEKVKEANDLIERTISDSIQS